LGWLAPLLLLQPAAAAPAEEEIAGLGVASQEEAGAAASQDAPTRVRPVFRRPGEEKVEIPPLPAPLEAPEYSYLAIPDRWRLVEALGVNERLWDPYHQNTLKGDRPIPGTQDWFANLTFISDTVVEPRRLPTPVAVQGNREAGTADIFGEGEQLAVNQNFIFSAAVIQGDTVFRPPDWEFRFTGVGNINYTEAEVYGLLEVDPTSGATRTDGHFAIQEAFADRHLWNKSERYDFDSLRVGIQPFISDFRGFLFQDVPVGTRLFGTFENNRIQYNLAWFRRMEKDTNSGLNKVGDLRDDDVFALNVYYQDFPLPGFTLQGTAIYNRNREGGQHYNDNGFLERPAPFGDGRPHDYDVAYLGLNGDGHFDRLNLTFSLYSALGEDDHNPIAQRQQDIRAVFAAAEASLDFDWMRFKLFGLYASGDDDPFDGTAGGFDAIFENPQFAGADTSFWQRQAIPLIGGGGVILSGRNALLPSLRTSKEEGQSNFVNPGLGMVGIGADFDVLPELRLITNLSWLTFDDTSSLETLRVQSPIDKPIGFDISGGLVWRPFFTNNAILRLSGAVLIPQKGMEQLFGSGQNTPYYSVLANLILMY
jgi:hypothetical protein